MLPAKTLSNVIIDTVVYHIGRNEVVFYGDSETCLSLEFESDNYMAMPISLSNEIMVH